MVSKQTLLGHFFSHIHCWQYMVQTRNHIKKEMEEHVGRLEENFNKVDALTELVEGISNQLQMPMHDSERGRGKWQGQMQ